MVISHVLEMTPLQMKNLNQIAELIELQIKQITIYLLFVIQLCVFAVKAKNSL